VLEYANAIKQEIEDLGFQVILDDSDKFNPGYKFAKYEVEGVPLRVTVGPRDLKNNNVELARRDTLSQEIVEREGLGKRVEKMLEQIQQDLFESAKKRMNEATTTVDNYDDFKEVIEHKSGFVWAHWDGTEETEQKIKDETKATIRCIPFEEGSPGQCMVTGKPSEKKVLFAKAY